MDDQLVVARIEQRLDGDELHAIPEPMRRFQDRVLIWVLLLLSGIQLGTFLVRGMVPDGGNMTDWTPLQWASAAIWFGGGVCLAGAMIRLSSKAVVCFSIKGARRPIMGAICTLGMLLFGGLEFWAGLVDRSTDMPWSPWDRVVQQFIGLPANTIFVPSVVVIALSVPLGGVFWSFSHQRERAKDLGVAATGWAYEEDQAVHNARMNQIRAAGARQTVAASVTGKTYFNAAPTPTAVAGAPQGPQAAPAPAAVYAMPYGVAASATVPLTPVATDDDPMIEKGEVIKLVREHWGILINNPTALKIIGACRDGDREQNTQGRPYKARRSAVLAVAALKYAPAQVPVAVN